MPTPAGRRRAIRGLLLKIFPAFALSLLLWQALGVGDAYHRILAATLDAVWPVFDGTGLIAGVVADGDTMIVRLQSGMTRQTLEVTAHDVTSNWALFLALFAASPMRRRWRQFGLALGAGILLLFIVHVFTFVSVTLEALASHPLFAQDVPPLAKGFARPYNLFYVEFWMYLVVLLLWIPYILGALRTDVGNDGGRDASVREATG